MNKPPGYQPSLRAAASLVIILTITLTSTFVVAAVIRRDRVVPLEAKIQAVETLIRISLEAPEPSTPEEQEELEGRVDELEKELETLRERQETVGKFQVVVPLLTAVVGAAAFLTSFVYHIWDEQRTRMTHNLTVAKTQLEIDKMSREKEEADQKKKKR